MPFFRATSSKPIEVPRERKLKCNQMSKFLSNFSIWKLQRCHFIWAMRTNEWVHVLLSSIKRKVDLRVDALCVPWENGRPRFSCDWSEMVVSCRVFSFFPPFRLPLPVSARWQKCLMYVSINAILSRLIVVSLSVPFMCARRRHLEDRSTLLMSRPMPLNVHQFNALCIL